jgi:hypothetical protein
MFWIWILLWSCGSEHASVRQEEPETIEHAESIQPDPSKMRMQTQQANKKADCMLVYLRDQFQQPNFPTWQQPDLLVYESTDCASKLPKVK